MASKARTSITPTTLQGVASEVAPMPLSKERIAAHAATYEALLAEIAKLRTLPLKDIEPATTFSPLRSADDGRDD